MTLEMTHLEFLTCLVLIFFSACIAASEIAIFSLSRFQLRFLKEHFRTAQRRIKYLLLDPGGLLITTLVINEMINIAVSAVITRTLSQMFHFSHWIIATLFGILVTGSILLIFCEITPKVIGARLNSIIAPLAVSSLYWIYIAFAPVRFVLNLIIRFVSSSSSLADKTSPHHPEVLKESDFLILLEEGIKEGTIRQNEFQLIRNVIDLDADTIEEITTPLAKVVTLSVNRTLEDALIAMRVQRFNRIPIVSANRKEVVGILYSKDLIRLQSNAQSLTSSVSSVMHKPLFVPHTMKQDALFRKFKLVKTHMAIVKGSANETLGVVTLSDLLDSLFDEIFPEEEVPRSKLFQPKKPPTQKL